MQRAWMPPADRGRELDVPQHLVDALYVRLRMGLTLIGVAQTSDDRQSAGRACRKARDFLTEATQMHAEMSSNSVSAARIRHGIDNLERAIRQLEAEVFPAGMDAANERSRENKSRAPV